MSAVLSPCGNYRYSLDRVVNSYADEHWPIRALWVMLNPSTADATIDDPTIRRVKGFTAAWNHTRLTVVNLYAYRATDPTDLLYQIRTYGEASAVGPANDVHLMREIRSASTIICAWGAAPWAIGRARDVVQKIHLLGKVPMCLGETLSGATKHPLYLPKSLMPRAYLP